jgi:alpha-beta hydrolase superfamily lysophospholipase
MKARSLILCIVLVFAAMFLFLRLAFFLMSAPAVSLAQAFKDVQVSNSIAEVTLRIHGDSSAHSELVLCIPGMSPALAYEWSTVAEPLSKAGYLVAIINLHGAQKHITVEDMVKLITLHILKHPDINRDKYILMGKSWGGNMAVEVAIRNMGIIPKLALIAPAGGVPKFLAGTDISSCFMLLLVFYYNLLIKQRVAV